MSDQPIHLTGRDLTTQDVVACARTHHPIAEIEANTDTHQRIQQSADWVQTAIRHTARRTRQGEQPQGYYGINTGFGIHAVGKPMTDPAQVEQLMRKLIMSHATGTGAYLDPEIVRATMLIRANTLARGRSGVRPLIVNRLIQMVNRDVVPAIPRMGSLGASGDLAPLSHLALVLSRPPADMEEVDSTSGEVMIPIRDDPHNVGYRIISGEEGMYWDDADQRVVLRAKEGLALNNGTTISTAIGVLSLHDAENLVRHAQLATALSLEALLGYRDAFLPQLHAARPHPGQSAVAATILELVEGSQLVDPGHLDHDPVHQPPQDAYSLRCAPQVTGAIMETLAHIRDTLEREINATTDNPLIFAEPDDGLPRDYKLISGGNFHGEPIAFAMDHLSIALTELGSISERRSFWLMNPTMARGLPSMLVTGDEHHMDSGLMITQYVAASLISKCKTLSHPDSVDSIPSSANQEDHVSMSMNAALHAREIVEHITAVLAIELLAAVTALRHRLAGAQRDGSMGDPRSHDDLGQGAQAVFAALEEHAPQMLSLPLDHDVVMYPYLRTMIDLVQSGVLVDAVQSAGMRFRSLRSQIEIVEE